MRTLIAALALFATTACTHTGVNFDTHVNRVSDHSKVVRYRDRVYRGSGVRPENRCFEIRYFDRNEGIYTSRYECR